MWNSRCCWLLIVDLANCLVSKTLFQGGKWVHCLLFFAFVLKKYHCHMQNCLSTRDIIYMVFFVIIIIISFFFLDLFSSYVQKKFEHSTYLRKQEIWLQRIVHIFLLTHTTGRKTTIQDQGMSSCMVTLYKKSVNTASCIIFLLRIW